MGEMASVSFPSRPTQPTTLQHQRQHRTLRTQKGVLPYALYWSLCPVSAALASIIRMDSIATSYATQTQTRGLVPASRKGMSEMASLSSTHPVSSNSTWRQLKGKFYINLPQMLPLGGSI